MNIKRKISWKASLDQSDFGELERLDKRMKEFYKLRKDYFLNIDYAGGTWIKPEHLEAQDMVSELSKFRSVLEVGCGNCAILKHRKVNQEYYTGLDFSEELIIENACRYPKASFKCINDDNSFPVENEKYDCVFSHFVIEHCVFPNKFLDECVRVLKTGGIFLLLCPDFLGTSRIASQRVGFSPGPGSEKLSKGKYIDALVTAFDNRIRIPVYSWFLRQSAKKKPRFYINTNPTCFVDPFSPDVDAVYIAFKDEIQGYLSDKIKWEELPPDLKSYSLKSSHIYIKGRKV